MRYCVFGWDDYYPPQTHNGLIGGADTLPEAEAIIAKNILIPSWDYQSPHRGWEHYSILDSVTMGFVKPLTERKK